MWIVSTVAASVSIYFATDQAHPQNTSKAKLASTWNQSDKIKITILCAHCLQVEDILKGSVMLLCLSSDSIGNAAMALGHGTRCAMCAL